MNFETALLTTAGANTLSKKECLMRCANVARDMLYARGFTKVEGCTDNFADIESAIANTKPILKGSGSNRCRDNTVIYFFSEVKIGVKLVRELIDSIGTEAEYTHIVLVSAQGGTSSRPVHKMDNIEFLTYKQIVFNITKHILVPKHTFIDKEQANVIMDSFVAKANNFPDMLSTDPVAIFCNFQVGDLIQIEGNSMGGVTEGGIRYRMVIGPNT